MKSFLLTGLSISAVLAAACGGDDESDASGALGGAGGLAAQGGAGGAAGEGATAGGGGPTGGGSDAAVDAGAAGPDYADEANWLCLPGKVGDVCAEDLDALVVHAGDSTETEVHDPSSAPEIDCFYAYPTISADATVNSDMIPGPEEINITKQQAARLSSICRLYAPVYRQVTLSALFGSVTSEDPIEVRRDIAYGDVLSAWEYYLAEHNEGRGVVFIGHSQGAGHLKRLIQERIDDTDLRSQLVAAYIVGSAVAVPDGADVGVDFDNVPACRSVDQIGCVVSYMSFAATAPPPPDSRFGRPRSGPGVALCVNPASPAGGSASLSPYYATDGALIDMTPFASNGEPYITFPELFTAECVRRDGFDILEVSVTADPADARPDTLDGRLTPDWGLHLIDLHLTMGDVERLVTSQTAAYLGR